MRRLLLVGILLLSGCTSQRAPVSHGFVPEIPLPERPKLQELTPDDVAELRKIDVKTFEKLKANNEALMLYSIQQRAVLDGYNSYAAFHNAMVRQALGMKQPDKKVEAKPDE